MAPHRCPCGRRLLRRAVGGYLVRGDDSASKAEAESNRVAMLISKRLEQTRRGYWEATTINRVEAIAGGLFLVEFRGRRLGVFPSGFRECYSVDPDILQRKGSPKGSTPTACSFG